MAEEFKRRIAYKLRIGDILGGNQITDGEKLRFLEIHGKNVSRVNVIANITEKYMQDEEKKFASLTIDDASGQIKAKLFGEDIEKMKEFEQGDTVIVIGLIRQWNNEIYLIPEIIKKRDPKNLLVRKLETEINKPKSLDNKELGNIKNEIISIVKREEENDGADIDQITKELNQQKETVNQEIRKLLEEGIIYEPRPGKVRYLG